ncbi:MAG: insulinase family protein [Sedimentisphaerales bacterium]|nr:insulinase family protein [Sedimentisphaerales bacterium]
MAERLDEHILGNGMVVLGEPMDAVESAAFNFMLPAGAAVLPEGCCGAGNVISDWIFRGAGDKSSRELGDALDGLGLHRSELVGSAHISLGAALEASNLAEALNLYADIILRPSLQADQFAPARQLAIDGVHSLDDDPRHKVMIELREQFYPHPLGRSTVGRVAELESLTAEKARAIVKDNFNLSQTIFAVAGKYDFEKISRQLERLFAGQRREPGGAVELRPRAGKYTHIDDESAQVHIGLMTDSVTLMDEDYYNARLAVSVLSGGMSARLFTEVREKRGLCYAIGARYHALKDAAGIMCYAGTTPEKSQETLDVITSEFSRLADGISDEELARAKVGLKSALILQSESSSSRAGAIGGDYYVLGRVRSLDEIKDAVEATTVDSVVGFLRDKKFKDFTVVTVGPKKVSV